MTLFLHKLKIRYKIALLSSISLIGFLGYLAYSVFINLQNEERFVQIDEQDYPVLEIVNETWLALLNIEAKFEEAILEEDLELLNDVHQKEQEVVYSLQHIGKINPVHAADIKLMTLEFKAYFLTANAVALSMIKGEINKQKLQTQLALMHHQYKQFKLKLNQFKKKNQTSFSNKLQQSKLDSKQTRQLGLLLGVILIALLLFANIVISNLITFPLKYLTNIASQIADGQLNVEIKELPESSSDELAQLTNAFCHMKSELQITINDLIIAKNNALAGEKTKSEFLSTMSHEIRTPMNGILGMADLLDETEPNTEQKIYIKNILNSGRLLLSIINDILDYAKLEEGKVELEQIAFDLEMLAYEVQFMLKHTHKKDLELILDYPPELPRIFMGDPVRLRQVLFNLIGNALKFTEQGYIRFGISCETSPPDQADVFLEVEDTGIGIAAEHHEKLFKSFNQVDSSTTRKYGGSGLGLAISQKLISLLGGKIKIDSASGKGSRFYFNIPLTVITTYEPANTNLFNGVSILLVVENEINRHVFSRLLQYYSASVTMVEEPEAMLPLLQQAADAKQPYHIVILDDKMSAQNNISLSQSIRADSKLDYLALLILTSFDKQSITINHKKMGFTDTLSKPLCRDTLQVVVSNLLAQADKYAQKH